ncbi:MAG: hypothetical protein HGA76_01940, partial [Candidatus Firestonebacteria bacterium]|nr:hypothetical protein [Candidatus Firestonebacteria bacterium]
MNADQRRRLDRFVTTLAFWCVLGTVAALGALRLAAEHLDRRVEIAYPESALITQTLQDP